MIEYNAKDLSTKQNYKFLTGSIIPRPIAWITTLDSSTQVVNAAPFSYFNVVAKDLPLVSLSINRNNGKMKDTAKNLSIQKEGVIHLVNETILSDMNATAASLPATESELTPLNLTTIASKKVQVPAIAAAPIRMEVKLHQYVPITVEKKIISDLFILEVLNYYFDETIFDAEKEYIHPEKFRPYARLAGNSYSQLGKLTTLKRPN